jgi:heme d1 biosynthesis radical SAM protein NirJ
MFRVSTFMQELLTPTAVRPRRDLPGPVVIWNLIRRCNLMCKHCYSISGNVDFPGELSTAEVFGVMDDLKAAGVRVLILSGGEPLLRPDIFEISHRAKEEGFYVGLSSNGTLITGANIDAIAAVDYNYVGVSLDGIGATHDHFRRRDGAFGKALNGLRLCRDRQLKTGMRFTMTMDNAAEFPRLLDLMDAEGIDKFYLSHLVYAGRGNKNRGDDAERDFTRAMMDRLFARAWEAVRNGENKEYVTGNNDTDGVYLLHWVRDRFPEKEAHMRAKLAEWGGNSSGVNIANIDNLGNVHPDTMWWHYSLGNVKERRFADVWQDTSDPVMAGLKRRPRQIEGRCGQCRFFDICGGNTRVRAMQLTGNPWAEDPSCYMTDAEIGVVSSGERLEVTPFRGKARAHAEV